MQSLETIFLKFWFSSFLKKSVDIADNLIQTDICIKEFNACIRRYFPPRFDDSFTQCPGGIKCANFGEIYEYLSQDEKSPVTQKQLNKLSRHIQVHMSCKEGVYVNTVSWLPSCLYQHIGNSYL